MQTELNNKSSKIAFAEKTDLVASTSQKQDLWNKLHVYNNVSVPTPVFNKLLEDYSNGGKQNNAVSGSHEFGSIGMASSINNARNFMESETLVTAGLPCHRYIFNDDNRIQRLVYDTRTGKEVTGRLAYTHFTKAPNSYNVVLLRHQENGRSRKPRKKRASKKK